MTNVNEPPADSISRPLFLLRPRMLEIAGLPAILAIAAGMRLWAIDFGFPERLRPDEQYFVYHGTQRFDSEGTLDPGWYMYPSFYMYVNFVVWRGYCLVERFRAQDPGEKGREGQRATFLPDRVRKRNPNIEYLLGRCVTAIFGIATVLLVYLLSRRLHGTAAAMAAGLFLAANGVHSLNSHFYKSDVATTFFTMAALLCMVRYVEGRRAAWNLAAAAMTGLAAATNYYGGFVGLPLAAAQFMAHYRAPQSDGETPGSFGERLSQWAAETARAAGRSFRHWGTYVAPLLSLAVFVAATPYCFIHWPEFSEDLHRMVFTDRQSLFDTMVRQLDFDDYGFQGSPLAYSLRFCLRYSMGLLLSVVSVAGLVSMAMRRRAGDVLLLLFFLVHFFMIATGKAVFMRYWLSLVPVLAISAGAILAWTATKVMPGRTRLRVVFLSAAILACGFESAWVSVQQNRLLAREDTRVEARRWLEKNLPGRWPVGVPKDWWDDFYRYGKPTLPPGSRYIAVRPEEALERKIRFLLVDDSLLRLYSPPERKAWSGWLNRNARPLREISPYDRPTSEIRAVYDQLDAFYVPVARFRGIVRPGPRIRVYAISAPE